MPIRSGTPQAARGIRPKRQPKPTRTRLYVPGFLSDEEQFAVDQSQLGIALPVIGAGVSLAKNIFKTPSEKRAANVIGGVISSANSGNLAAVAILDTRRFIGISKERAVWSGGFNKVVPSVISVYNPVASKVKAMIPAGAQASPEDAARWATTTTIRPQDVAPVTQPQPGQPVVSQPVQPPTVSQPVQPGAGPVPPPIINLPPINVSLPSQSLPGGEPQVPPTAAQPQPGEEVQGVQTVQAGMGASLPKLMLIGVGAFVLAQVFGKRR